MSAMIANHLWQSTLFAVLIGLLTLAFRADGAHARYWLWFAASVKFLVPFSLLTALGRSLAPSTRVLEWAPGWSATAERIAQPVATTVESSALVGVALLTVWLAGALGVLRYWLVRARRVRALLGNADPAGHTLRDHGREIRVYESADLVEPSLVGVLSSALLLPRGLAAHLTAAQLEAIIAHEVCHARRRDNLAATVHMLVETVFWFHPLVWWIGARLVDERERACDEAVVRAGHDRATYAEGVLTVCELYARSPHACAAGVCGADLKRRVTHIMRGDVMSKLGLRKKVFLSAVAAAAVGAPALLGFLAQSTALAQQGQGPGSSAEEEAPFLPVVKVAPRYPQRALERRLEGYVVVEYTVTEQGRVEDAFVVESSSNLFEEAALESARLYEYEPRMEDGEPVAVSGVQTVIRFELEEDV